MHAAVYPHFIFTQVSLQGVVFFPATFFHSFSLSTVQKQALVTVQFASKITKAVLAVRGP